MGVFGSAGDWLGEHWGTSDPTAVLDPDRQFGFELIDVEDPDDAVFGETSREWAELDRTIENADDEIAAGLEDVWNQSTPDDLPDDPVDPFTPDWLDWVLNNQEVVALGVVVLAFAYATEGTVGTPGGQ